MSIWGRIFGTEKALDSAVTGVVNGLDKLVYTDEEKADARKAMLPVMVEWMKSTQGQNVARRALALVITAVWLFMYLVATLLDIGSVWADPVAYEAIKESGRIIGQRAFEMNGAMMLILGFYFAAPHMSEIVGVALGKFAGTKREPPKG